MSDRKPPGGWDNFDPVSAEDRLLVAGLASDTSVLVDELVMCVQSSEYPADCAAAAWVSAYDDMPLPTDIGEVMLAIHQVHSRLLAAADCLRGLSVVVANRSSSFSVGVLAWGARSGCHGGVGEGQSRSDRTFGPRCGGAKPAAASA